MLFFFHLEKSIFLRLWIVSSLPPISCMIWVSHPAFLHSSGFILVIQSYPGVWYRNKPPSVIQQVTDCTESENNSGWNGPLELSISPNHPLKVESPSKVHQVAHSLVQVSFGYL